MMLRKIFGPEGYRIIKDALWEEHSIYIMVLGICAALAVSNTVENAIAMGAGVTFVLFVTSLTTSTIREYIPQRVRIVTYMVIISSSVIIVHKFLEAFFPEISKSLGPYVGLIITNCLIMGRAEAFFSQKKITHSLLDGLAHGVGYTYTLVALALIREFLGFGTLMGIKVTPGGWTNWVVMAMAPGAFFLLGIFLWIARTLGSGAGKRS